jgi:toxin FitB
MRIIDSNLIIYFADEQYRWLEDSIQTFDAHFSIITKLEVLGFQKLKPNDTQFFKIYFRSIKPLPISDEIIEKAIELKQKRKMSIGDAIIAATALVHNLELFTHNITDFDWILGLKLVDPMLQKG